VGRISESKIQEGAAVAEAASEFYETETDTKS
jgi:hypothetical protein